MAREKDEPPAAQAVGAGLPAAIQRALVLGAGRSGIGAAVALAKARIEVTLSDRCDDELLPDLAVALHAGVRFVKEATLAEDWPSPDLVIKSPGVFAEAGPVVMARERGVPVWSELELAYALLPNTFDAVTGTNGKTTTAALLGHLLTTGDRPVRVLGNIGVAVTSVLDEIGADEELVVEVSSFQLEDIQAFRPAVGVFLNLTPDHLDRHGSMERYLACKANLFVNQRAEDVAVLNLDDPVVAGLGVDLSAREGGPRVAYFSVRGLAGASVSTEASGSRETAQKALPRPDSWIDGDRIFLQREPVLPVSDIRMPGRHNLENCLAAGTAALARGVDRQTVAEGLATFEGVVHRLETAGMVSGVTYVNDSKATNVEATLTALNAFPERTHLILGGRDKASDYRPVARACARGCRAVYLIGEATPLIAAAFAEVAEREGVGGMPPVQVCGDLETAVRTAAKDAVEGDTVLLAPACASFDQYADFEERGEHFRTLVRSLGGKSS